MSDGRFGLSHKPDPSEVDAGSAAMHGMQHWKSSVDFWAAEIRRQNNRFARTPFYWVPDVLTNQKLKKMIRQFYLGIRTERIIIDETDRLSGKTGGVDDECTYWYQVAHNKERYARLMNRLNDRIEGNILLKPVLWLWNTMLVKGRERRAKRLIKRLKNPGNARRVKGRDLITIVMPTYNRGYVIGRAIDSVLNQSYQNWELIIVDDGSTDNTKEVLGGYPDARITVCHIPKSGVCPARNAALDLANGKFITFLDSDNIIEPDFLKELHKAISAADDDVGLVYCDCSMFQENEFVTTLSSDFSDSALFSQPFIDLGTIMCRREVFDVLRFDERMNRLVDYELMLRISKTWKFSHLKKSMMHYFRLKDGITNSPDSENVLDDNNDVIRQTRRNILRVGYVLWDYPALSQTFVHSEIEWLIRQGIDVKVYYRTEPDKTASLGYHVDSYKVSSPEELAGLVQKHRRHILHTHFAYPAGTLLTWPAAEKAKIRFTLMPHAVDVFTYENMKVNRFDRVTGSKYCRAVFAYGPFHREFYIGRGGPADKVILKPNSLPEYLFSDVYRVSDRPIRRIVYFGRLVEKKGVPDIIRTARRLTDLDMVFDIYGYGPLEKEIIAQAEGLSNVNLHIGGLSHDKCMELLRESDLFFLPCIRAKNGDMDGLPTVLMEAAAVGVPVITTPISSTPVLVEDGVTGYTCEPGDIDCFERRIRSLAGKDPSELSPMLDRARDTLMEKFHPEIINNLLLNTWIS